MARRFRFLGPLMDRVPYRHAARVRALLEGGGAGGGTLVDVGGGTGRVARRVAPGFRRVVVVDHQPAMLRRAGAPLRPVAGDARHVPLRDGAASAVLMTDAFHHFAAQRRVLREARRVLAPGGRLVVEEFDPGSWGGRIIKAGEWLARFGSTFHPPEALRRMVDGAGFVDARVERLSGRDYAVVATAPPL